MLLLKDVLSNIFDQNLCQEATLKNLEHKKEFYREECVMFNLGYH